MSDIFVGEFFQLYWHEESEILPDFLDLRSEKTGKIRRIYVHRDRYIAMQNYILIIPKNGEYAYFAELGIILIADDRGVRLGVEDVA